VTDRSYIDQISNIKSYFDNSGKSIHKARNEIKIIDDLVVKSFKIPHILNKIIYTFFRKSKAEKSYINGLKVGDLTPKPIGYIEFKKYGLLDKSFFVSENFKYDFTIREPLLDKGFPDRELIFQSFAKFSYNLHQKGIIHLDYSPGNILIKKEDGNYIFKIVDINRMKFKKPTLDERLKNFSKLWAKDEDLSIIIKEYAKLIGQDEKESIKKAISFSKKHKDIKNLKKRLKGQKVVD
jgi:serine/threonine protein kinase